MLLCTSPTSSTWEWKEDSNKALTKWQWVRKFPSIFKGAEKLIWDIEDSVMLLSHYQYVWHPWCELRCKIETCFFNKTITLWCIYLENDPWFYFTVTNRNTYSDTPLLIITQIMLSIRSKQKNLLHCKIIFRQN